MKISETKIVAIILSVGLITTALIIRDGMVYEARSREKSAKICLSKTKTGLDFIPCMMFKGQNIEINIPN